jgi:hypothetical protein
MVDDPELNDSFSVDSSTPLNPRGHDYIYDESETEQAVDIVNPDPQLVQEMMVRYFF